MITLSKVSFDEAQLCKTSGNIQSCIAWILRARWGQHNTLHRETCIDPLSSDQLLTCCSLKASSLSASHAAQRSRGKTMMVPCDTEYPAFVSERTIKETAGSIDCDGCFRYGTIAPLGLPRHFCRPPAQASASVPLQVVCHPADSQQQPLHGGGGQQVRLQQFPIGHDGSHRDHVYPF